MGNQVADGVDVDLIIRVIKSEAMKLRQPLKSMRTIYVQKSRDFKNCIMTIYPQRSEITALHFNKVVFLRVLCYKFHRSLKSARYIAQAGREGEQKTKKKHSECFRQHQDGAVTLVQDDNNCMMDIRSRISFRIPPERFTRRVRTWSKIKKRSSAEKRVDSFPCDIFLLSLLIIATKFQLLVKKIDVTWKCEKIRENQQNIISIVLK